jgi:DNA-directed RNA polymerase II subunit RPB2
VQFLREKRREGNIPKDISIVRDIVNKEIRIFTDGGRLQRPLFIVKDNHIKVKKSHIRRL